MNVSLDAIEPHMAELQDMHLNHFFFLCSEKLSQTKHIFYVQKFKQNVQSHQSNA